MGLAQRRRLIRLFRLFVYEVPDGVEKDQAAEAVKDFSYWMHERT